MFFLRITVFSNLFQLHSIKFTKGKGKGHPRTGHEVQKE